MLEPANTQSPQEVWEDKYAQNEKWGPLVDAFRTKILKINKHSYGKFL